MKAIFILYFSLEWQQHTTDQIIIMVEGKGYYKDPYNEVILVKKKM